MESHQMLLKGGLFIMATSNIFAATMAWIIGAFFVLKQRSIDFGYRSFGAFQMQVGVLIPTVSIMALVESGKKQKTLLQSSVYLVIANMYMILLMLSASVHLNTTFRDTTAVSGYQWLQQNEHCLSKAMGVAATTHPPTIHLLHESTRLPVLSYCQTRSKCGSGLRCIALSPKCSFTL